MPNTTPPFQEPQVQAAFEAFPDAARETLLALRALIFDTAASMPEAGRLQETLKWGQPSYLTPQTRAGSTLRLGVAKSGRPPRSPFSLPLFPSFSCFLLPRGGHPSPASPY